MAKLMTFYLQTISGPILLTNKCTNILIKNSVLSLLLLQAILT